jgi:hypothetical protein
MSKIQNSKQYYQDLITEKSFKILQDLRRQYEFILIGGWAVFLYTHSLKSKDIDIVIEYGELEKLRQKFVLTKNDRLKKYEVSIDEIDVDIYLPFHSNLAISIEEIQKCTQKTEGFVVPRPEILLILKQKAYIDRGGTPKGEKDKIDIVSLLSKVDLDFEFYKKILKEYNLENYIEELKNLFDAITEVPELKLNQFQYSKLKKKILERLYGKKY